MYWMCQKTLKLPQQVFKQLVTMCLTQHAHPLSNIRATVSKTDVHQNRNFHGQIDCSVNTKESRNNYIHTCFKLQQ